MPSQIRTAVSDSDQFHGPKLLSQVGIPSQVGMPAQVGIPSQVGMPLQAGMPAQISTAFSGPRGRLSGPGSLFRLYLWIECGFGPGLLYTVGLPDY